MVGLNLHGGKRTILWPSSSVMQSDTLDDPYYTDAKERTRMVREVAQMVMQEGGEILFEGTEFGSLEVVVDDDTLEAIRRTFEEKYGKKLQGARTNRSGMPGAPLPGDTPPGTPLPGTPPYDPDELPYIVQFP